MTIELDLLSEAIPHQIAIVDAQERLVHANAAYQRRYGLPLERLIGKTLAEVIGEAAYAKYAPFVAAAIQGESGCIDHKFTNRFEGRAWRTTFLPRQEGGCIVVSDDPGDLDPGSVRIQRAEERLQAFVDFAPIGMIFSHLDGRVLEANDAFLSLIGFTREDLQSGEIHWDRLTPAEYLPLDYAAIAEAKETGRSRTYEKEYLTKSGTRVHVLLGFILVGPTRDEAVAFIVDITAQNQAEEEVRRLNAELEERVKRRTTEIEATNRELEAFCYSVSHDLRAPLRSIDGFAYALFQDYEAKLDSDAIDFINRIRGSAKRMDELISALLALSRLTRVELDEEKVDLSELAESVAAEIVQQFPDREILITVQPQMTVRADRRMLCVVIDNLIGNAIKFTSKAPKAVIAVGLDKDTGAFFVKDNGVGFNMEESSKLFQPFERLHSPKDFNGSGIRLATVQRIVRKHGGNIWAEAEMDKGATFFFTL